MDIYCNDGKCPICERALIKVSIEVNGIIVGDYRSSCPNECYSIVYNTAFNYFFFFNKEPWYTVFSDDTNKASKDLSIQTIKDKIAYWREDYRYLSEILERR